MQRYFTNHLHPSVLNSLVGYIIVGLKLTSILESYTSITLT